MKALGRIRIQEGQLQYHVARGQEIDRSIRIQNVLMENGVNEQNAAYVQNSGNMQNQQNVANVQNVLENFQQGNVLERGNNQNPTNAPAIPPRNLITSGNAANKQNALAIQQGNVVRREHGTIQRRGERRVQAGPYRAALNLENEGNFILLQ